MCKKIRDMKHILWASHDKISSHPHPMVM